MSFAGSYGSIAKPLFLGCRLVTQMVMLAEVPTFTSSLQGLLQWRSASLKSSFTSSLGKLAIPTLSVQERAQKICMFPCQSGITPQILGSIFASTV